MHIAIGTKLSVTKLPENIVKVIIIAGIAYVQDYGSLCTISSVCMH